ncbi:MAG: DNA internalization-related competence protein ComEC/Rec2 [Nitrospirales bacterium]
MILSAVLSYVIGLFLGPYVAFFPLSLLSGLLCLGFGLTWLESRRVVSSVTGVLCFVVLVVGIGQAHWSSFAARSSEIVPALNGQLVSITGEIVAPVRYTPEGLVLIVGWESWTFQGQTQKGHGRIRVTWRDPGDAPVYGNRVQFTGVIREPYGTHNPRGFDYGQYLRRQGIHAVTTLRGGEGLQSFSSPSQGIRAWVWERVDHWRKAIHDAAVVSLSNPALGLFLGMVLGEQSFIEPEVRDAFMASGTVHILSISGSHLGLLAFLIFTVVRGGMRLLPAVWVERISLRLTATRCAVLVTLPVVSFYALLAGAEMATVRSWIMIVVFGVGVWFGRARNIATALAVAGLIMLIPHPEAVYDISFQLSYLSVAAMAMVLWFPRIEEEPLLAQEVPSGNFRPPWASSLVKKTRMAWSLSLAVSLATLPLVALYFHQIAWLGLGANLVVVPLVGVLVIPLGLFCGIAELVMRTESIPFAELNQWVFEVLALCVAWMARIPWAEWHVASPSIGAALVFWIALAGGYVWYTSSLVRWGGIAVLIGLVSWWAWSPRSGWEPGHVQVTFMDVGQGDATLIELPDGQTVLIDGGPAYSRLDMGRAVIGPLLWNKGIRRLDHVIATHPQWDHVGGLPWVLHKFQVGQYWSNGINRDEVFFQRLQSVIHERGIREAIAEEGQELLRSDTCSLNVLNPPAKAPSTFLTSSVVLGGTLLNNHSLITRLECGSHSFLLTADAEHEALERMAQRSDGAWAKVVKIPHHGAKSSLSSNWIHQLKAESLVVSVGAHNRYGHPAPEVVEQYRKKGIPLLRTDIDGAIWFTASLGSGGIVRHTAREYELAPVVFGQEMWDIEGANWRRL